MSLKTEPAGRLFRRVAVIGLGLIGGSLALAAKNSGRVGEVLAADRSEDELALGVELGIIDGYGSISDIVTGADLVVIAVPVRATVAVLQEVEAHLAPDAVLTDVGSTKGSFVQAVNEVFGGWGPRVIPGHPIAGSEKSGVRAARAELFEDHKVILTPPGDADASSLERLAALWEACGATVLTMDVNRHDEVLAATSHLPHLIAFSLVDTWRGRTRIWKSSATRPEAFAISPALLPVTR